MKKVGIAGVPNQEFIDHYKNAGYEFIDLDMPITGIDYFDVIEKIAPKIYCATLKTVFVNALIIKPDIILADVGEGKCDGMRFIAEALRELLPNSKIITTRNMNSKPQGNPISVSDLPLREKMNRIVNSVIMEVDKNLKPCKPTAGFWGVPPRDFAILDIFPNTTHVYGWARCMENKAPDNMEIEMFVDEGIPIVFFAQSFCQKTMLAKYLANKYNGLFVDVDAQLDDSTKAKVIAFLTLRGAIK
ncbi:TPA: hypothetical protein ENX78_09835 [Candidatus Poribacteria bacterium]|nr:hypothetical protein [Candidatus Poribacteria bacterium]